MAHVVLMDLENGLMLATDIGCVSTIGSDNQQLQQQAFAKSGLPELLLVRRQAIAAVLGPLAQALSVPLHCDERLSMVTREVHQGLAAFLAQ